MHAFDYSKVYPGKKWIDATLEPHASFVSKRELRKTGASFLSLFLSWGPSWVQVLRMIRVSVLPRALKIYLARTQDLRGGKKLLLVSLRQDAREISIRTLKYMADTHRFM